MYNDRRFFRSINRVIFYKREQARYYDLLNTRMEMLGIRNVNKDSFIQDKASKGKTYKWVATLKPADKKVTTFKLK